VTKHLVKIIAAAVLVPSVALAAGAQLGI